MPALDADVSEVGASSASARWFSEFSSPSLMSASLVGMSAVISGVTA